MFEQLEDRAMLSAVGLFERVDNFTHGVSAEGYIQVIAGFDSDSWSNPGVVDENLVILSSDDPPNPNPDAADGDARASGDLEIRSLNPTPELGVTSLAEVTAATFFTGDANAAAGKEAKSNVTGLGYASGLYTIDAGDVPSSDPVFRAHFVINSEGFASENGDGKVDVATRHLVQVSTLGGANPQSYFLLVQNDRPDGWHITDPETIGDYHAEWNLLYYNLPPGVDPPVITDGVLGIDFYFEWEYDGSTQVEVISIVDYANDDVGNSIAYAPAEISSNNSAGYNWYADSYVSLQLVDAAVSGTLVPGGSQPAFPEFAPPKVTNVTLSHESSATTHPDYEFDGNVGSGEQLKTVPVGNVDTIAVQFTKEVVLTDSDLELIALNKVLTEPTPDLIQSPNAGNDYTAIWSLSAPLQAAQYLIRLADTIEDLAGNALDGEWTNPGSISSTGTTVFPSGDNVAGGDFEFVFTILPGDANRDNQVGGYDFDQLLEYWGDPLQTWDHADWDGDGTVDNDDLNALLDNWGENFENLLILGDYNSNWSILDDSSTFVAYYTASPPDSRADLNGVGGVTLDDAVAFADLYNFGVSLSVI